MFISNIHYIKETNQIQTSAKISGIKYGQNILNDQRECNDSSVWDEIKHKEQTLT